MDRKELAVKSSVIGFISKLLTALLAFVSRKIFLQYLGSDLLGVSSTLTQILETLSLTELGFQTTIIFRLYKPLVEKNYEEVSKIMMLLKKIYLIIGVVIFVFGVVASFFLKYLITRVDVEFSLVYMAYFIMLIGTVISYLFSYNRALLQADQKIYINNLLDGFFQIVATIVKLVAIVCFKSFVLYVVIGLFYTIGSNVASYMYYKKYYPWINKKAKADKKLLRNLVINTKDVFIGKISGYVYSSTDNLVISAFAGTSWVGLIGNYTTIINAIKMIIFGLTGPIQPMLGNFAVSKTKEETEKTMLNYGFIRFILALFTLVPTLCLSDMFVGFFYGEEYIQSPAIVCLLVLDLFIICMQGAVGEMIDALGYFREEKKLYIVYALTNLILSCIGAKVWGVIPVFVATVLSQMLAWIWRSIIAYKKFFQSEEGLRCYWFEQLKNSMFFVICTAVSYGVMACINLPNNFIGFVIYAILIECLVGTTFFVVYHKKEEFKYVRLLVGKILHRGK